MMSNGHRLELSEWGDGTLRLAYWDSLHGMDLILVVKPDGGVMQSTYAGDEEMLIPVNLHDALMSIMAREG